MHGYIMIRVDEKRILDEIVAAPDYLLQHSGLKRVMFQWKSSWCPFIASDAFFSRAPPARFYSLIILGPKLLAACMRSVISVTHKTLLKQIMQTDGLHAGCFVQ